MTRLHHPDCRWERTTPAECEYRDTHHYCPHREHACDCAEIDADRLLGEMAPEPRATDARLGTFINGVPAEMFDRSKMPEGGRWSDTDGRWYPPATGTRPRDGVDVYHDKMAERERRGEEPGFRPNAKLPTAGRGERAAGAVTPAANSPRPQEIRVPIWWRKMTKREREVMQRVLERQAQKLIAKWDTEDGR